MDELEHVINCLVAMREAEEAKLKEFGFTWTGLKAAKKRVVDAIPPQGIDVRNKTVITEEHDVYMIPADQKKIIGKEKSIHIHEKRG